LRGCGSSVYSIDIAHLLRRQYLICASICSSVKSGRNENVPCVTLLSLLPFLVPDGRDEDDVRGVGGLEVERDVLQDLERGVEVRASLGDLREDVRAFLEVVAAPVAGVDHRLDRDAVGGGAGGDAHRVA